MNITWYVRRLSKMDLAEVLIRGRGALTKQMWRHRQGVRVKNRLAETRTGGVFSTGIPPIDKTSVSPDARARIQRAADEVLGGRWPVFDQTREDMAEAPDWFLDLRTGNRAPSIRYAFDIDCRDVNQASTVKYVWETSRHHHMTMMAAAYWLTGRDDYAELIARHMQSWLSQNPFLCGIHWTSGIELGIRLISWVWARRLLDGWQGTSEVFEGNELFLRQLYDHQAYLARFWSPGSSANNHILAEMAGLFVASCAFPCFPESSRWRKNAATRLSEELQRQTFASGLNRELATGYHGLVLEMALAAALEGEASGHPLGGAYWSTVRDMTDALAAIVDCRLQPPRQGDDDGGQGLLLDTPEFDRWTSLLATGKALFGACDWWPKVPEADLRTLIWMRFAAAPRLEKLRPDTRLSLFPDAGMVILRHRAGSDEELWCRGDCGPHGYLSIAAHAHADALSIELRHGGVEILCDPGTYVYQGDEVWRTYFRSTLAHNCLELNGTDQSIIGGPFMWLRPADSRLIDVSGLDDGSVAEWAACHDGYNCQPAAAEVRRRLSLDREAGQVVITDVMYGESDLPCRLLFHLGPMVYCRLKHACAELRWQAKGAIRTAVFLLPHQLQWRTARGESRPPLGWYSPAFGVKVPSTSLVGVGRLASGTSLVSQLIFVAGSASPAAEARRAISDTNID